MTTDFPFDPPYKLAIDSPAGKRWVEVRADGSQVDTTPPATTLPPPSLTTLWSGSWRVPARPAMSASA